MKVSRTPPSLVFQVMVYVIPNVLDINRSKDKDWLRTVLCAARSESRKPLNALMARDPEENYFASKIINQFLQRFCIFRIVG